MGDLPAATRQHLDEAGLNALVEHAPDAIFVADLEGRYTYVDGAACRLLGYSCEELLGMTIGDVIPAHDVERLARSKAAMLKGQMDAAEWSLRRKDGTFVPVEVNANILPNGQWQGFVRDISERKAYQAEREALFQRIETERRWRQAVMDTLPIGVVLLSTDGKLSVNHHVEEMFGTRMTTFGATQEYASRVFFPDGRPVPAAELFSTRIMGSGECIIGEELLIERPDGTRVPVIGSAAPILDDEGRLIGGVAVLQDTSQRMQLEQAARANERLLKAVFDLLPVGVWIADKSGRIVSNNPAGERIWGGARHVPVAQFGEYKGWWVDTGEAIAPEKWALARALTEGVTSFGELVRIQCFDGSFKTIINSAAPLRDENGETAGAIVVNEDITALHQTQEQLRTAVRDREQILAVVTHDLRNPLSAIKLIADAAERKALTLSGGEPVRKMAASILELTQSMSALVDDLLSIAVAGPGRSMLKIVPVKAEALLARAAGTARPLFARAGLTLEVEPAGELPILHVDAHRILRVFANLLDNAMKFTDPPGKAVLRAETLSSGVRFCVGNTGPPLSRQEMDSMFQPFWQAARTDRRGAGLGLAICRSIVEAHGGSIWAEPCTGLRVRICVLLPCASAQDPAGAPAKA